MTTATDIKYIVCDPEVYGGKPCIDGHRIAVHDIASDYNQGRSPQELADGLRLTLAEVHAALTYYYDHKGEIDEEIEREEAYIKQLADADTSPTAQHIRRVMRERHPRPTR